MNYMPPKLNQILADFSDLPPSAHDCVEQPAGPPRKPSGRHAACHGRLVLARDTLLGKRLSDPLFSSVARLGSGLKTYRFHHTLGSPVIQARWASV